ncbi:MAG: hexitol phosphatase HxpB [Acidimicrobiales bacterium]
MIEAVIFDMDGLLTESESRWRQAEQEACDRLGLPLGEADFVATMGMRMREVTRVWFAAHPWTGPDPDTVAEQVVDRVVELCADAAPLPGVLSTIDGFAAAGLPLALCSSSDHRLIDAVLDALDLGDRFVVVHSAADDDHGKPHPEPYLATAAELGVNPRRCLVFEDSVAGCVAAKAAGMTVVAVPAPEERGSARFGFADLVLESLDQFDPDVVAVLADGAVPPTLSRPRFHLAIHGDDLDQARRFYLDLLGAAEGRSTGRWVDFDLWGHQLVVHRTDRPDGHRADPGTAAGGTGLVDGEAVPIPHFGLLLPLGAWQSTVDRLIAAGTGFLRPPTVRFPGQPGEQHTCFVTDPAGNVVELKAFRDDRAVFALHHLGPATAVPGTDGGRDPGVQAR